MRAVASLAVSLVLATILVIAAPVPRAAADEGHQLIAIASYDITGTPMSGFGCWGHTYDGTVTDTGRTAGGSVDCSDNGDHIANYRGGSGTLNDGVIGTSDATHLFLNGRLDDAGNAINPTITLHLAEPAYVQGISLYGGDIEYNGIPGALTAMTVAIAGKTMTAATAGFGPLNALNVPVDDYFDLDQTEETWYPTSTIVLRDFQAEFLGYAFDQFSLTEITVDGDPATEVDIEVKGDTNTKAGDPVIKATRGKVPVIIYGSSTFSVTDVQADGGALFFGVYGWELSLGSCNKPEDVNKDGYPDLTCQFISYAIDWTQGLTTVRLNGRTTSGDRFFGTDTISVKS